MPENICDLKSKTHHYKGCDNITALFDKNARHGDFQTNNNQLYSLTESMNF